MSLVRAERLEKSDRAGGRGRARHPGCHQAALPYYPYPRRDFRYRPLPGTD